MKKLLTFLFALVLLSGFTYGAGNLFVWNGSVSTDWQVAANWTKSALPYGEAAGTSTWPGELETGDMVRFNDNGIWAITNVPPVTLGRMELTFPAGTEDPCDITLIGAFDGAIITMRSPSAEIITENTFWIVKVEKQCVLNLNDAQGRVKLYMSPNAHFWQKDLSYFFPAEYDNCDVDQGFVLMANAAGVHAEYIAQKFVEQDIVKGWVQYGFDNDKHHYFSPPVPSVWPLVNEFNTIPCRKANTVCAFEGDFARRFIQGGNWDNWLGVCTPILTNTLPNFTVGEGYDYFGNNAQAKSIYEIYGEFNTQIFDAPNTITPVSLPVTSVGWNFVGNPFPSAITFQEPSGQPTAGQGWEWDLTKIAPIAYYWDNSLAPGGAYHTYNWFTGVGNGPVAERRLLARSQAFFVDVMQVSPITMTNETRVFRGDFKIGKSSVANYLTLTLNDASGTQIDDAIIGFRNDANGTDYNRILDTRKLFNEITGASQMYFKSTDNEDLSVKTLQLASGNIMYPLYFRAKVNGSYTINAKDLDAFSQNTSIMLYDNRTQSNVDLRVTPSYTFIANEGDDDARFTLHFANVLYGIDNLNKDAFKVYAFENTIYVQNDLNATGNVSVYDMIGKQMVQENLNNSVTKINTNLTSGFYMVSVKTDKGVYNQKVYIN